MAGGESHADAVISGSPWSLVRAPCAAAEERRRRDRRGPRGTRIRGDAEIASRYRELFALARPDLEEELSRLVGDVPARRLSQFAKAAFAWARKSGRTAGENVAEYLQEESRDLVNRAGTRGISARRRRICARRPTASRSASRSLERRLQGTALMRLRVAARLLQIQRALVRHGLDDFVRATHLYRPFRFLFYLSPWTWFQRSAGATRGERLRLALEELGPIFVKFGQALSTRRDLLPVDIADELAKLQDRVPPFDSDVAVATIERAYRPPARRMFSRASIGPRSPPPRSRRCMRPSSRAATKSS